VRRVVQTRSGVCQFWNRRTSSGARHQPEPRVHQAGRDRARALLQRGGGDELAPHRAIAVEEFHLVGPVVPADVAQHGGDTDRTAERQEHGPDRVVDQVITAEIYVTGGQLLVHGGEHALGLGRRRVCAMLVCRIRDERGQGIVRRRFAASAGPGLAARTGALLLGVSVAIRFFAFVPDILFGRGRGLVVHFNVPAWVWRGVALMDRLWGAEAKPSSRCPQVRAGGNADPGVLCG